MTLNINHRHGDVHLCVFVNDFEDYIVLKMHVHISHKHASFYLASEERENLTWVNCLEKDVQFGQISVGLEEEEGLKMSHKDSLAQK